MKHEEGFFSGRYMNLVHHFLPLGYAVYAIDHVGHGRSEGERLYVERFTDYTDTLAAFCQMIRKQRGDKPVIDANYKYSGRRRKRH